MKIWRVRFKVNSYLIFDEQFTMNKFIFFKIGNENYASHTLEADSIEDAEDIATKELNSTLKMIEFTVDEKFTCTLEQIEEDILSGEGLFQYKVGEYLPAEITFMKSFRMEMINEIENFNDLLSGTNTIGENAYKCYLKGLEVYQWNSEAFLNFFRSIETISAQYLEQGKKKKKIEVKSQLEELTKKLKECINNDEIDYDKVARLAKKIYDLGFIEVRKKINLTIQDLGVKVDKDKLDKIVKLRPKVAHGGTVQNVTDEDLEDCKFIAKEIIISYIKKYKEINR